MLLPFLKPCSLIHSTSVPATIVLIRTVPNTLGYNGHEGDTSPFPKSPFLASVMIGLLVNSSGTISSSQILLNSPYSYSSFFCAPVHSVPFHCRRSLSSATFALCCWLSQTAHFTGCHLHLCRSGLASEGCWIYSSVRAETAV